MAHGAAAPKVQICMNPIALARKWRPKTFSELVGQDHINKALVHSLTHQRMHHAYLFTGTRGVGKTSIARLLAKALNCEQGTSATPCLVCDTCVSIQEGRYIDLIEIDGASKTKVEDTRELLDNVPYAPTLGRFKVYLIDEVHMLSQHSFNALLKTLEEPPAHVIFILATTDPQKLPLTILSRCLQFHLKPLQLNIIIKQLSFILNQENIVVEENAIKLIAQAAQGSMRDALSLLDQAIASGEGALSLINVQNSLGLTHVNYAQNILEAFAARDIYALLAVSQHIGLEGGNYSQVLQDILSALHQISVLQALGTQSTLLDIDREFYAFKNIFTQEETQLLYQIALKGAQDMLIAPTLAIGFEMTLLRMHTFIPAAPEKIPLAIIQKPEPIKPIIWSELVAQLNLTGLALAAIENTEWVESSPGQVTLRVSKSHRSLFTQNTLEKIEQALTHYYQEKIKLILQTEDVISTSPAQKRQEEQQAARHEADEKLTADPFFQTLKQKFSAKIIENSVELLKYDI